MKSMLPCAVTVGTFDGLHQGHQLLLRFLSEQARQRALQPMVFTFDRHPLQLIAPNRMPSLLLSHDERDRAFAALQMPVVQLVFDDTLRNMSTGEFMRMLHEEYNVSLLVVGYDNRIGYHTGDVTETDAERMDRYIKTGQKIGMEVIAGPLLDGVSSSVIRSMVERYGDIEGANVLLGCNYELSGRVVSGHRLGRRLGYPTANIEPLDQHKVIPMPGVYAAHAKVEGEKNAYPAMVNIGYRPTVAKEGEPICIEANLAWFDKNIYGKVVTLSFVRRLRDEKKFPSIETLKDQLHRDLLATIRACRKPSGS